MLWDQQIVSITCFRRESKSLLTKLVGMPVSELSIYLVHSVEKLNNKVMMTWMTTYNCYFPSTAYFISDYFSLCMDWKLTWMLLSEEHEHETSTFHQSYSPLPFMSAQSLSLLSVPRRKWIVEIPHIKIIAYIYL